MPKKVVAGPGRTATQVDHESAGHVLRRESKEALEELDDGEVDDTDDLDLFTSPVGGGGSIGNGLKKLPSSAWNSGGSGGGSPGADLVYLLERFSANSWRARGFVTLTAPCEYLKRKTTSSRHGPRTYPNWDAESVRKPPTWLTLHEVEPRDQRRRDPQAIYDAIAVRVLGALSPAWNCIVATVSHRATTSTSTPRSRACVEARPGSVLDEVVDLESLWRRRDLSCWCFCLLTSRFECELGPLGALFHQQQRARDCRPHCLALHGTSANRAGAVRRFPRGGPSS